MYSERQSVDTAEKYVLEGPAMRHGVWEDGVNADLTSNATQR
jgi:hypothetical protein